MAGLACGTGVWDEEAEVLGKAVEVGVEGERQLRPYRVRRDHAVVDQDEWWAAPHLEVVDVDTVGTHSRALHLVRGSGHQCPPGVEEERPGIHERHAVKSARYGHTLTMTEPPSTSIGDLTYFGRRPPPPRHGRGR